MICKEVLTQIYPAEFLKAAEASFKRASGLSSISDLERKNLTSEFHGYAELASYVERRESRRYGDQECGKRIHLGMFRLGLAIREWFYFCEVSGLADEKMRKVQLWLGNLGANRLKKGMKRYLGQEADLEGMKDDNCPTQLLPPEVEATTEEYEAFMVFSDELEDRLVDGGMEKDDANDVGKGVLLGSIAIREAVELHNLELHIGM